MQRSVDRFLTTHQGSLARPRSLMELQPITELCLTALAPATTEFFMRNEYYASDEEYVYSIAEAMRTEYLAVTEAGLLLQLDEPALATNWQVFPDMDVAQFRKWVELRVEALNHAWRGIPSDRVRMHVRWGSIHHPHRADIPLEVIVDLLLKVTRVLAGRNSRRCPKGRASRLESCGEETNSHAVRP